MNYELHDLVGIFGVVLVLAAYLLLQLRKLSADRLEFSVANAIGAGCILLSLTQDFNLPAFMIELAWLLISVYGMLRIALTKASRTTN